MRTYIKELFDIILRRRAARNSKTGTINKTDTRTNSPFETFRSSSFFSFHWIYIYFFVRVLPPFFRFFFKNFLSKKMVEKEASVNLSYHSEG